MVGENILADETLKYIKETVDSWDCTILPKEFRPYIARLQDEEQPDGLVELVGCDGVVRLTMCRADYDEIMRYEINVNKRSN